MCNTLEVKHKDDRDFVHTMTLRRGVTRKQIADALHKAVADKSELVNWSTDTGEIRLVFGPQTYRGGD